MVRHNTCPSLPCRKSWLDQGGRKKGGKVLYVVVAIKGGLPSYLLGGASKRPDVGAAPTWLKRATWWLNGKTPCF